MIDYEFEHYDAEIIMKGFYKIRNIIRTINLVYLYIKGVNIGQCDGKIACVIDIVTLLQKWR